MRELDFTLSAGPTEASATTLAALGAPITYHYDPLFLARYKEAEQKVADVFRSRSDVVLLQGEAVLGLEAAARALVRPGMHCLNLVSGVFGKGLGQRLQGAGAVLHELEVPYDDAIDSADVERALRESPDIELVAVVHCETPSGTLNPIEEIGPIAKAHGAITIVDCVSSLGGVDVRPDEWGLDICVAGAQKCLAGPAAPALVVVSSDAWAAIAANDEAPRGSYVSLLDWKEKWLGQGVFPFTPLVSDVLGLAAACEQLLAVGLEASFARHELAARACRTGVLAMGLEIWPRREEIASPTLTAIRLPEGLTDLQVRAHARERYGVMLSGAQGAGNLVRIGHMGVTARGLHPIVGLVALGQTLIDLGAPLSLGAGIEEAARVLADAGADQLDTDAALKGVGAR
jgi:pyridoxamine---pyruvate transaminase